MESRKKRLLVIGIDGGTLDIILPLVQDNKLPNLGSLIREGTYGELLSTIPPVTAPAWSSFITGTNPGQHGVFHFFRWDSRTTNKGASKRLINFRDIKGIPFWRVLNKYGYKAGLMNIPLTYPPDKVDSFMISGMLVPPGAADYIYPRALISELDEYKVDLDGLIEKNKWQTKAMVQKNRKEFVQNVFNVTEARCHNALKLMKGEAWDLFMVVFTGSDRICHFFWEDEQDDTCPSSLVADYYIYLDGLVGRLMDQAGDETVKLVMSDHGFGEAPTKSINAYMLARKLGGSKFEPGSWLSLLRDKVLRNIGIKKEVAPRILFDKERSKLFLVPIYANFMGIAINTENEKKMGFVPPGKEYEHLTQEIIGKLGDLVDPLSGQSLVAQIHHRDISFSGPYANQAPDIVVEFSNDYKVNFDPFQWRLVTGHSDQTKTGEHRREGFLIASGPCIARRTLGKEISIQDLTPTLLYFLGVPIPKTYDGRLIEELFSNEYLAQHPPEYVEIDDQWRFETNGPVSQSQEDVDKLKEILQNLGYL